MIVLHQVGGTRSFRVLWLLAEMGITPELQNYTIGTAEMQTPEFRKLSPAGRVPALEIDGRVLYESGAIIEYLVETRPEFDLAPAIGSDARARYFEAFHFAETQAQILANLNLQYLFLRDPAMRSATVLKIDTRRLALTMQAQDDWLMTHEYMGSAGFSAADTMMGFNLNSMQRFVRLDKYPHLSAYRDRMMARPAYQNAIQAQGETSFYRQEFYGDTDG